MVQHHIICLFALIAALQAASVDVQTCKLNGKIYKNSESFLAGSNGCAKCVCVNGDVSCDVVTCQQSAMADSTDGVNDYANIRNQLAKQYFSTFDGDRLKKITDTLGCKTTDCPQLIAASKIDYNVVSLDRREYVGRSDKQNKIIIHSTDAEAVNNSPSPQEVTTVGYSITATEYFEATINKTIGITADVEISIKFLKINAGFKFGQTYSETRKYSNTTTIEAPSQKVIVDAYTKMNVTFNFYQYEDVNNYFLDFVIKNDSTIIHPDVGANSNVIFVKNYLGPFLQKNVDYLPTITYEHETDIKIIGAENKFVLKNFPATERLTNVGVDVVYGKAEPIEH